MFVLMVVLRTVTIFGITIGQNVDIVENIVRGNTEIMNCSRPNSSTGLPVWWFRDKIIFADKINPQEITNIEADIQSRNFTYLKVTNFSSSNVGRYKCAFGLNISTVFELHIREPTVTILCDGEKCPVSHSVNISNEETFECYSDQEPLQSDYLWSINNGPQMIGHENRREILTFEGRLEVVTSSLNLTISKNDKNISCSLGNVTTVVAFDGTQKARSGVKPNHGETLLIAGFLSLAAFLVLFVLLFVVIWICRSWMNSWNYHINVEEERYQISNSPHDEARDDDGFSEGSFTASTEFYEDVEQRSGTDRSKPRFIQKNTLNFYSRFNTSKIILRWKGGLASADTVHRDVAISYVEVDASSELKRLWNNCCMTKLSTTDHVNVLQTIGYCKYDGLLYIIQDYSEMTTLDECLKSDYSTWCEETGSHHHRMMYALDVVRGMDYLTTIQCCHPGLQTKRVLVNSSGFCKLYDFCSKKEASKFVKLYVKKDPEANWTLPPELSRVYEAADDVWGIGICLWEIYLGDLNSLRDVRSLKEERLHEEIKARCQRYTYSKNICTLIMCCLSRRKEDRRTITDIKEALEKIKDETETKKNMTRGGNTETNSGIPDRKSILLLPMPVVYDEPDTEL